MKKAFRILSVLMLFLTTSCFTPYPTAPSVNYENMSNNFIREMDIVWSGRYVSKSYHGLPPGLSGVVSFDLRQKSDFYGPVHISWKNAQGKTIVRDFVFKKEHLPDFDNKKKRSHINLYFTQDDVLIFVATDRKLYMNEEQKSLGRPFLGKYSDYYHKSCPDQSVGHPPCKLPIQSDLEWEKIADYYISKYGVEAYKK